MGYELIYGNPSFFPSFLCITRKSYSLFPVLTVDNLTSFGLRPERKKDAGRASKPTFALKRTFASERTFASKQTFCVWRYTSRAPVVQNYIFVTVLSCLLFCLQLLVHACWIGMFRGKSGSSVSSVESNQERNRPLVR